MRPSLVVSLLVLSFLLQQAQGIRLEKGFKQVGADQKVQAEEITPLKEKSNVGGVLGEAVLCKEGQCTGMNRKLIAVTTSTSSSPTITTSKNEKNGENKADPISKGRSTIVGEHEKLSVNSSPKSEHQVLTKDHYEETMDLTEMDYSPARRKPPIHN
ncbi:hypothetical protein OIU76_010347 [Salix suchowensis]|uniref:Phytosulfokine-beta n=2 Tax=Salix TaxID=40685 RepID=A0A9Q0ZUG3_9ROSI|nr:Peptidase [Salix suchowensis]KAJ6331949.1 hypothetical protein OIU76_010347 [Salix suchowensis]KAJ6381029.1 hypothetical protein OIU77_029849 [Salix suchowensis]KAJ6747388.1 hypothetical protein OIU74_029779 [Salix koriyanagi]